MPSVLPLGGRLQAHFAAQVGELPAGARRLLLLAALDGSGDLRRLQAAGAGWTGDLAQAEQARLARVDESSGRLVFRHPLVRSAIVELATEDDRRLAHRALAEAWLIGPSAVPGISARRPPNRMNRSPPCSKRCRPRS